MTSNQPLREVVLKRMTELATGVAQPLGLSVLEVRLNQKGQRRNLEVCIFRKDGEAIGLGDCEQVSRALERLLEEEGQSLAPFLEEPFQLEVFSPGIERQLTTVSEFDLFSGRQIRVTARENIGELGSEFVCVLLGGNNSYLDVSCAQNLLSSTGKISKSKGRKKKVGDSQPEQPGYSSGQPFKLELARVYKVNLYSGDVKKGTKTAVH